MRKKNLIINVLFIVTLLLSAVATEAADNPYIIKYPFETVKIVFTSKGSGFMQLEETLYIKGHNTARLTITTANIAGNKNTDKKLVITKPDFVYTLDLVKKSGVKSTNPVKIMSEEFEKLSQSEQENFHNNMKNFGNSALRGFGAKGKLESLGKENIQGKECEIYEVMGMKTWVWTAAGEVLKMTGMQAKIATSLEENIPISDAEFAVPPDIQVTTDPQDAESVNMTKQMFQMIKSGQTMKINMPSDEGKDFNNIEENEGAYEYTAPGNYQKGFKQRNERDDADSSEEDEGLSPEDEARLRKIYQEQGMDPAMIDNMLNMMKQR